jgi:hypothetical protein
MVNSVVLKGDTANSSYKRNWKVTVVSGILHQSVTASTPCLIILSGVHYLAPPIGCTHTEPLSRIVIIVNQHTWEHPQLPS